MNRDHCTEPNDCGPATPERLRYFTGRFMTARDFRDADAYHRWMRHRHNRLMHGTGVARGLHVRPHDQPGCGVVVECGLAIDCCGREITVPHAERRSIDWTLLPSPDTPPPAGDATAEAPAAPGREHRDDTVLLLCLSYDEDWVEKTPVLYSTTACCGPTHEEGRIRESYQLGWKAVRRSELPRYGWHAIHPHHHPHHHHDHHDDERQEATNFRDHQESPAPPDGRHPEHGAGRHGQPDCVIDPHCPPGHVVALAVVVGQPERFNVETRGRPALGYSGHHLTHICWTSWPHGGLVPESRFKTLRIGFDRELRAPWHGPFPPGPYGINECTFVVRYGDQHELDFVHCTHERPPRLAADRRTALFEVERPRQYVHRVIHVMLRCDFILDCHGHPVDGSFLGGQLPTGNGTPGGLFESWFRVVHDDDYKKAVDGVQT